MISIRIGDWSHLGSDATAVRTAVFVQEQGINESLELMRSGISDKHIELRGMQVRGSSRELGRLTTVAVVQSIFLVILADAIFAVIFMELDI